MHLWNTGKKVSQLPCLWSSSCDVLWLCIALCLSTLQCISGAFLLEISKCCSCPFLSLFSLILFIIVSSGSNSFWNTGCGRKNTPIWEGHTFGWGARRRTAVYIPFSVYTMVWLGEHRAFIVEEFTKNGRSPVATQRAFHIHFALGRWEAVPDKNTIYRLVWNFRQIGHFGSSGGGDTTGSCCHYTWNGSQGHGQLPRGYISVSIFKAATWVMICSKHIDVKRHSACFPEIEKHLPYLLWFWIYSLLK